MKPRVTLRGQGLPGGAPQVWPVGAKAQRQLSFLVARVRTGHLPRKEGAEHNSSTFSGLEEKEGSLCC